jgi:hypothetical protein
MHALAIKRRPCEWYQRLRAYEEPKNRASGSLTSPPVGAHVVIVETLPSSPVSGPVCDVEPLWCAR